MLDPTRNSNFDETGVKMHSSNKRVLGIVDLKHCFEIATGKEKMQITVLVTVGKYYIIIKL